MVLYGNVLLGYEYYTSGTYTACNLQPRHIFYLLETGTGKNNTPSTSTSIQNISRKVGSDRRSQDL